jgi:putative transposase
VIRQVQDLHHIVEQDHRGVKRVTQPRRGCKAFEAAQDTRVGIELMPRSKKRQLVVKEGTEA